MVDDGEAALAITYLARTLVHQSSLVGMARIDIAWDGSVFGHAESSSWDIGHVPRDAIGAISARLRVDTAASPDQTHADLAFVEGVDEWTIEVRWGLPPDTVAVALRLSGRGGARGDPANAGPTA